MAIGGNGGGGTGRRKPATYACGVPAEKCSGSLCKLNNGMRPMQAHQSSESAFNCHKEFLLKQGYTIVDSRAFAPPNGGPIQVLTKKSRFGVRLRNGKEGTRNMAKKMFGNRGGVVASF
jgi:hypothetical protein